ncbi:hypothetical protein [Pseudomonas caspiana]|uniref:hypothetical protein n=1 Tax=Pseudomonas caspiana TaxID=1451454 RepID=UPI0032EABFC2
MREFMRQWFDVVALDETPCAPADIKLAPINIVCEFRPDYQFGYVRLPAIMVGIVGKSVEDARIASVVSDRTLPFLSMDLPDSVSRCVYLHAIQRKPQ